MSAICGVLGLDGRPFGTSDIAGTLAAMSGLGPHGCDTWDGQVGRMGVAVGARLRRRVREDHAGPPIVTSQDGELVVAADVAALDAALRSWPESTVNPSQQTMTRLRLALLRATVAGRYVRWFNASNRQYSPAARPTGRQYIQGSIVHLY